MVGRIFLESYQDLNLYSLIEGMVCEKRTSDVMKDLAPGPARTGYSAM